MNEWFRVVTEPAEPIQIDLSLPGAECFLPVASIRGICVLTTLVWVVAVQKHLSRDGHARRDRDCGGLNLFAG